ncbi:ELMO/CED-12 family-domain-containing protein [Gaertneriomyces semiglobifer]|nr:ELMO/CED-12 family-domain-containing protein [Gaertneriomyces semiglobifer]
MSTIISSHRLVHDLNARAATKYDPTNTLHEEKLLELWDLLARNERLVSRISDQWQKIGFQGKDPATDFRGMGMLGLDNLHYYAKIYPDSVRRVLALSHHPTAWFSFAIVGINITDFALQLLRTRQLQHFLYTFGTSREVFMEFYCYCFEEFATYWSLQPMVTVMDFGRVFGEFQTRIQMELIRCRETILDPESPVFSKSRKKA